MIRIKKYKVERLQIEKDDDKIVKIAFRDIYGADSHQVINYGKVNKKKCKNNIFCRNNC